MMRKTIEKALCLAFLAMACTFSTAEVFAQPGTPNGGFYPAGIAGVDYNVTNTKNKKQGTWIRVWPNGNLYYLGQFENDNPKGGFTFFYETGEIMSEVTQIENGRKAFTKMYRPDGTLQAEGMYMKSAQLDENREPLRLKQGEWKYYDGRGNLRLLESYDHDQLNGLTISYGDQGQELERGTYADGQRTGTWKTWDELGTLLSEINYRDGVFHGFCTINYANGRPQTIGRYEQGKEQDYWKTFMEDGTLETTRQFENGELIKEIHENGTVFLTYADGRPRSEFTVINQKKSGPFREWHDTGEWVIEDQLDPESGETLRKRVLVGEALRREGEYVDGKLEGEVYYYDLNGRLQKSERYENGKRVSSEEP